MASTSSETPSLSSSSASIPGSNYDVFLSFRGEDTRHSFTDHLHEALRLKGIEAFRDSEKLQLGQEIASELIQAIKKSQFAVVVFSEKYANSKWCLNELAEIVECRKNEKLNLNVVPVFYHVDPSHVRNQTGPFEKAFAEHQKNDSIDGQKIRKWKAAMSKVAGLAGKHLITRERSEVECIQDIVEVILNKSSNTFSAHTMGLIGIESRVEKLMSHLAIELNDVRIIGIWGTGGMGKTTLARFVYEMLSNKFEACCFIANVREQSKNGRLCKLQKILSKTLLMLKNLNVEDVDAMIKNRLRNKKSLLVLDDVTELDQLKKLAGEHSWFGSGSRVMITTRDKHLLETHGVNEIYEAEVLNHDEALKLFNLKALKMDHPPEDYGKLSQAFVDYSKGLPLALEVLGSFLFNKSISEWKCELDRLMVEFCDRGIGKVLQISFDELQTKEKAIFLYIACFFNHMSREYIKQILDYLELYAEGGLRVLIDNSLIKLHENELWMHDLLQEMGRYIVCQECEDPGKRSRLWSFKDIDKVLTENTGTEKIQGIALELDELKEVDWNPEAFSNMRNLKLLIICGVQLMRDLKHLPNSLRFLDWSEYPSESLTSSSQSKCFENLKFIDLSDSQKLIEAPDTAKVPNLESLILKGCINLPSIHPSIGLHKTLTVLNLRGCRNLTNLPSKFEMECLTKLVLDGCSKIKQIPEFGRKMKRLFLLNLRFTAITTVPGSIEHLTGLKELHLGYCKNLVCLPGAIFDLKLITYIYLNGCSKLDSLPENLGNAESLLYLYLEETAIGKVPSSIRDLKHLKYLALGGCKGLSSSSDSLLVASSLTCVRLCDCNLKAISYIGSLFSLEELDLSGNDFVCLPESIIHLSKLKWIKLNYCTSLRSLPKLPLNIQRVEAGGCISLEMSPDLLKPGDSLEPSLCLFNCSQLACNQSCVEWFISGIKKSLKLSLSLSLSVLNTSSYDEGFNMVIPGSEIPEWFSHQREGNKLIIEQPSHLYNEVVGIAICCVFGTHYDHLDGTYGFRGHLTANGKSKYFGGSAMIHFPAPDHLWLVYVTPFFIEESNKLLSEGDANGFSLIRIKIESGYSRLDVKKCGYRMIYRKDKEDLNLTMVQSSVTVERHKVKRSGAGPSGERSPKDIPNPKRIKRHTKTSGNSDSEESSEYMDCNEELSDAEKSSESDG